MTAPPAEPALEGALRGLREQIDAVDRQLVALLDQRACLALEVGQIKSAQHAPVYRPEREAEVLARVVAASQGPLPAAGLTNVFREVISACRALERTLAVAYLGPAGTFSELALRRQFGASVTGESCGSIDEVFRAVEAGSADFGIVPIENSTEGSITRTLDLLASTPLTLVAEVSIPVHHHLLTRSGGMEGVERICAHAQALAQCQGWLGSHYPRLERCPVASNAEAARQAADDTRLAAIAADIAAERYGLRFVAQRIEDDPANRTRFVVLGRDAPAPSGRDKTSLILAVPNRAGAVHEMLAPLAQHGVSMTRFESRPARSGAWEYYFYVDLEGHRAEPRMGAALTALQASCAFVKNLGSYAAAG